MPPNHELLESRTPADLQQEWYEDMVLRRRELLEQVNKAETADERAEARKQLKVVDKLFDDDDSIKSVEDEEDPLIAKWEAELAAGKIPDLDEEG